MRVEFYGLVFETPQVTFHLFTPWRCAALEHRLFEVTAGLPGAKVEKGADEWRVRVGDTKNWKAALQALERVLKGWQEDSDMGSERRSWQWLLEGDSNADGYDHAGEPLTLWGLLRVSVERGGPSDGEKAEDVDLEGFCLRIWGEDAQK